MRKNGNKSLLRFGSIMKNWRLKIWLHQTLILNSQLVLKISLL